MPFGLQHHPGPTSARYKRSKYLRRDAQLLGILRTTNMRFLLLTVLCTVVAVTVAVNKPKRDISLGDYHKHDHHENELEISRSLGGYVGSYSVLDDEVKQGYGPPNYQPNQPLNLNQYTTSVKNNAQLPVPTYGVPEVNHVQVPSKQYLTPVIEAANKVHTKTQTTFTKSVEKVVPNKETVDHLADSVKVTSPVTSYGEPVEVKTVENTQKSTLYEVPEVKTSVVSLLDTKVEHDVVPTIQDHSEETVHKTHVKTQLTVPQVPDVSHQTSPVVDSSLVLPVNFQFSPSSDLQTSSVGNVDFSQLALPTVNGHATFNDHLQSQSDFDSAYQAYLRNIGSFGSQQKILTDQFPNLYVSPYTYGVPYQFPQSLYTSQVHQSLPSQLHNLVPYPVAANSHLFKSNSDVKQFGPISTFFQDNFPNFQFQFPQLPNFGSIFQLPTPAPATPEVENLKTIQVQKPVEVKTLETTDNLFDSKPVAVDTSLTKTSTVNTEKVSNEYLQPVDKNGAYIY